MGQTQVQWRGNQIRWYDGTTHETAEVLAPRKQFEDFEGATLDANKWAYCLTANEDTQALDGVSAAVLTLLVNNTQQEAGVYNQGNVLAWDISKGLIIEFRLAMTVLPTDVAEVHIGVIGQDWVADQQVAAANDIDEHCLFVFDGSGVPVIYSDDGTNEKNALVTTGVAVVAGVQHVFRIDFTDDANVLFFIDGVNVGAGPVMMDDIASPLVQPYVNVTKHDGGGLGTITLDYIKMWQAER